jgi:hypothetical protein
MAERTKGLIKTFSDWLRLLDGPKHEVFSEIVDKEDWARLFKLLMLVLVLSGAVLGAKLTVQVLKKTAVSSVLDSPLAITFLIVGSMLAVAYSSIARLFGIKLSLPKAFFIILALLLPWVPIANCIDTIQSLPPFKGIGVIFLLAHLLLIRPIYNFYQGVLIVTHVARWRALLSILLPITIFTFLVIYMFG